MPRSPAPNWRMRKEPILDHYIQASIDSVPTYDPDSGWYGTIQYVGCADKVRAEEIKQSLHRAAYYMYSHGIADIGVNTKVKRDKDGTYMVEFRATNKAHARAAVIAKYGPDRSKWPYNPRGKGK